MADSKQTTFSRRGFLKGAGLTAAGTLLEHAEALTAEVKKCGARVLRRWGRMRWLSDCR